MSTQKVDYSHEEERVKSFVSWKIDRVDPFRLAKAGFYYTGNEDEVVCFSCKGHIRDWKYGDVVLKRHMEHFPNCDFIRNRSNNVPLQNRKNTSNDNIVSAEKTARSQSKLYQVLTAVDYEKTKSFSERLKTFSQKWPHKDIDVENIARAGFFYLGIEDKVQCPFCKGILSNWERNDNPANEHIKHFPWCGFIGFCNESSDSASQVPWFKRGSEDVFGNAEKHSNASNKCKLLNEDLKGLGVRIHSGPMHPQQGSYAARLRSFSSWPSTAPVSVLHLAEAGFFYIGIKDHTKCFYCDGGLCNWEAGDDPWVEHGRWFRNCEFIQLSKGDAFIQSCLKNHQTNCTEDSVLESPSSFVPSESLLAKVDEAMKSAVVTEVQETGLFPTYLIRAAVLRQLKESNSSFLSVDELCIAACFLKEQMSSENLKLKSLEPLELNINGIDIRKCEISGEHDRNEPSEKPSRVSTAEFSMTSNDNNNDEDPTSNSFSQCLCKICMDKEVGVVFLPCGHLLACTVCAPALKSCPMCRKTIQATVRAYLP